jgi:hypothetical protein
MDAIDILSIDAIPPPDDYRTPITKVGTMFSHAGKIVSVTKIDAKFGSCAAECDLPIATVCYISCPLGAGLKFKYVD